LRVAQVQDREERLLRHLDGAAALATALGVTFTSATAGTA